MRELPAASGVMKIQRRESFLSILDFAHSLIALGGGAIFAFAANIVFARLLGAQIYGSYITMLSAALAVGGLAAYGTNPLLTREISAQPVNQQNLIVKQLGIWSLKRTGLLSLMGMAIVLCWLLAGIAAPPSDWHERIATLVVIPGSMILALAVSVLAGLSKVALSQAASNTVKNGLLLFGAGLLMLLGVHSANAALWLQAITIILSLCIAGFWVRRYLPGTARQSPDVPRNKNAIELSWRRSARHFFAVSASLLVLSRLDVVVVGAFTNQKQVGLFGAAARVAQFAGLAGTLWIAWLQPRISRQYVLGRSNRLKANIKMGLLGSVGMTAIVVAVGWLVTPWLTDLMGASFSPAIWPLRCLLGSYLAWSFCVPYYAFLSMAGYERQIAKLLWAQSILTLTITAPLCHYFGASGAAVAWFTGTSFATIWMVRMGLQRLRSSAAIDSVNY